MGKFSPKFENFRPLDTFQFILKIFAPQTKMMNSTIKFQSLEQLPNPESPDRHSSNKVALPEFLVGDNIRLKQLLVNFTKNATKFTKNGVISIKAAYDT